MPQTTLDEWVRDPVDPEIRAHVYSLISAVRLPFLGNSLLSTNIHL